MDYEMTAFEKEMEQNLLELRSNLLAKISKSDSDFQNLVGSSGTGDSVDIASDDLASKKMEAKMNSRGIFDPETNKSRARSLYHIQLKRAFKFLLSFSVLSSLSSAPCH